MSEVIVPAWARWYTPREEHTDEYPFCGVKSCLCHFDPGHMQRHFVDAWLADTSVEAHEQLLSAYRGKVEVSV